MNESGHCAHGRSLFDFSSLPRLDYLSYFSRERNQEVAERFEESSRDYSRTVDNPRADVGAGGTHTSGKMPGLRDERTLDDGESGIQLHGTMWDMW